MSKKDKKCQCDNHEQELNEECKCNHEECCCEETCNCDEEQCCCENECCGCENQDIETSELLSKRISELNEALLRSQAELLNYKKRKDDETARILKYAEKEILEGFRMVYNQTRILLEKFEVKEIDCLGKEFDPSNQQAVVVEKDETKESGVVLEVLQKGYMYKDRVLRIAMVKVNE